MTQRLFIGDIDAAVSAEMLAACGVKHIVDLSNSFVDDVLCAPKFAPRTAMGKPIIEQKRANGKQSERFGGAPSRQHSAGGDLNGLLDPQESEAEAETGQPVAFRGRLATRRAHSANDLNALARESEGDGDTEEKRAARRRDVHYVMHRDKAEWAASLPMVTAVFFSVS